ncbi:hydroxyacylglutathione hydrolase [Jannaschia sp. Os4]|uniref:hydroxyacylglutathione hydrolase n=1 Tax=Jannaschia sp. Os4 TaxID=2807617 RepID=UPI00193AD1BC|nr:hydroxyacylglutathione hydrolase [Jannaschia sp. Os4]MBM2576170.1 hydroxyacylglutathione hydrolase [Jannaschia sp. Os4]
MTVADTLVTIPCLEDNYAFLFRAGDRTVLVDVPKAAPIAAALDERGWRLTDVLLTHHHWDHVDALPDLLAMRDGGVAVWGAEADAHRLPPLDERVVPGTGIEIGGARAEVWDVSGHTMGHVAFVFDGVAFTGDSLMAGGCGRLFEGTPERMHESLSQFDALPDETLIASGHEYTTTNLRFALSLEPGRAALTSRLAEAEAARAAGRPTVPSTLGLERRTNPFLRSHDPALKAATDTADRPDVETFAATRRARDRF